LPGWVFFEELVGFFLGRPLLFGPLVFVELVFRTVDASLFGVSLFLGRPLFFGVIFLSADRVCGAEAVVFKAISLLRGLPGPRFREVAVFTVFCVSPVGFSSFLHALVKD
jgi:hypothetical protein